MKRHMGIIGKGVLFLAIMGFAYTPFVGPDSANACGYGSPGGGDYVPQKRGSTGAQDKAPSMTKDQAYDIVSGHIKRLNPELEVGEITDVGRFFQAEILGDGNEVIERLAVDKYSGRILIIN